MLNCAVSRLNGECKVYTEELFLCGDHAIYSIMPVIGPWMFVNIFFNNHFSASEI